MSFHANKRIIFDRKKLRKAKTLDHPRASIKITKYGTNKFIVVSALADTSAQSNLWGWNKFHDAGFDKNDLLPLSITIRAANKIPVKILRAFRATFSGTSPKIEVISCNGIIYVSESVTGLVFFLSYEKMVDLLIIDRDFLTIGSQLPHQHSKVVANLNKKEQSKLNSHDVICPKRSKVPEKPGKLPFKA